MKIKVSFEMDGKSSWTEENGHGRDDKRSLAFDVSFSDDICQSQMIAAVLSRVIIGLFPPRPDEILAQLVHTVSLDGEVLFDKSFLDAANKVIAKYEDMDS